MPKSFGHGIERLGDDRYRLSWATRRISSRMNVRTGSRITDQNGADRFVKRWGLRHIDAAWSPALLGKNLCNWWNFSDLQIHDEDFR